jgi:hypothetical protein
MTTAQENTTSEIPHVALDSPLKIEEINDNSDSRLETKTKILYFAGVLLTLVISVISVFLYYSASQIDKDMDTKTVNVGTPEPSSTPIFSKSDWTIEVENGSLVSGVAAAMTKKLTDNGFQVVGTGNAKNKSMNGIGIFINVNKDSSKDNFINLIKELYPHASFSGTFSDSSASARIIIGKQ